VRRASACIILLVSLPAASSAGTAVLLGVHGDAARFRAQTGQVSEIRHTFASFAQGDALGRIAASLGPVPLLALNSGSYGTPQTATPRGLAFGQNDAFLFRLNAVIAGWAGSRFYVRPFPEMNAHWSGTSAYNADGSQRDAAHSTRWNRKALARIAVVLRGGPAAQMSASLAKLGLPGVDRDLPLTTPSCASCGTRRASARPTSRATRRRRTTRATRTST
jgi:hypothetical protein